MEKRIDYKNEKGAITLYVLLACLFFVFILTGIYVSNLNKIQTQEEQIKQIQKNYAKQLERKEEIYEEIINRTVHLTIEQSPENDVPVTGEVELTATGRVSGEELKIVGYSFEGANNWIKVPNLTYVEQTKTVTENGTYTFYVKDNNGKVWSISKEVTNIDKSNPIYTGIEIKNLSIEGYDVYVYGIQDKESGINRVQFPTWTEKEGKDDIQENWETNSKATGEKQEDGTTWIYHVKIADHNYETGKYYTQVHIYDNAGNGVQAYEKLVTVPSIKIRYVESEDKSIIQEKGYGDTLGELPKVEREGYTFEGWYTEEEGGTRISSGTKVPETDVTYYAHWRINSYSVTFNSNMKYDYYESQSGFTITKNTESAGEYYRATFSKTSGTGNQWNSIKFPTYAYEVGATYVIRMKVRVQSVNNCSATLRHSAITNDYGTPGRQEVSITSGQVNEWVEYTLTRQITSSTITQSETSYTVNPLIEIYTSNLALTSEITSRSMTFDFKDVYVEKVTTTMKNYNEQLGTLETPIRNGYTFKGWYTERTGGTKISSTTTVPGKDITYYAQWEDTEKPVVTSTSVTTRSITATATDKGSGIVGYAITTSGTAPTNSSFTEVSPTVSSLTHTFDKLTQNTTYYVWFKDAEGNVNIAKAAKTTTVTTLVKGSNVTFTSSPNYWTNGSVKVTAATTVTGFTLQTSTNGSSYGTTNPITFSANGTMYARLSDGINVGGAASYSITNIDTTKPTITLSGSASSTIATAVSLSAVVRDTNSGLSKIVWYYKPSSKSSYTSTTDTYTAMNGTTTGVTSQQTKTKALTLNPSTTYNIYAVVYDVAGNSTQSSTINVTTGPAIAEYNSVKYTSIQNGINAVSSTGTVKVLANHTTNTTVNNPSGKNITLNMDSKTVTLYGIDSRGTLTINGNGTLQKGAKGSSSSIVCCVEGTINITNGTFNNTDANGLIGYVWPSGTMNIENGTFNIKDQGSGGIEVSGVLNLKAGTINITSSRAQNYGINAYDGGKVNFSGGRINRTSATDGGAVLVQSASTLTMSGSAYIYNSNQSSYGLVVLSGGTFYANGGTIQGKLSMVGTQIGSSTTITQ